MTEHTASKSRRRPHVQRHARIQGSERADFLALRPACAERRPRLIRAGVAAPTYWR